MTKTGMGVSMREVVADPDLTDEKLETIRLCLVRVRDGDAPASVEFGEATVRRAGRIIPISVKSERNTRDAPVVVKSPRVSGDFTDRPGGSCEAGDRLAGLDTCVVNVQFIPRAKGKRSGKFEYLLASTPSVTPQKRVTVLNGLGIP